MKKPVCAVVGVGPGNGAALARRFAAGGYAVALMARGSTLSGTLAAELDDARAYECDVADATSVKDAFLGSGGARRGGCACLQCRLRFRVPSRRSRQRRLRLLGASMPSDPCSSPGSDPPMKRAGAGSIIFIGATASLRGMPRTAAFAPAKAAQRILAESMARSLWPAGIHVALVVLDGVVTSRRPASDAR